MPKLSTPDAAESNAGDEFHVLWAMRKSLELLNISADGLKAISVEGLTKIDESRLTSGDVLLGVDLKEYYGGRDFRSAKKVTISQLKYSTRNASKSWTPSQICSGKKHKWKGSIIHKLADIFHEFYVSEKREDVLKKLSIKLVSNRPASKDLEIAIKAAHSKIIGSKKIISLPALLKGSPAKSAAILKTFFLSSGLKIQEFVDFITIFDLADCNSDSRYGLKQKLLEAIAKTGNIDVKKEYNELYQLVKEKTLPEGQIKNTLVIVDILYMFGFSDFSDLFPASSSIQPPTNLIRREQIQEIVDLIQHPQTKLLLLHAGAGMGKSTMTELIIQNINTDHCVILFDCYGGGSYLDSDDKRHKHGNALLQLSNELALKSGSPFLITRNLANDIYLREFQKRIEISSRLIKKINPLSQVILIIDAADNSVHGANEFKEDSFVQDLLTMSIPDGCKIIVTARSERVYLLKLPAIYDEIEILSFSFNETKRLLIPSFPNIKDQEIEEFRKMTKQTPRVMAYAMAMPGELLQEKMIPLRPDGKSIDNIFKLMIDETAKRSGNKQATHSFLRSLINLPRPVPLNYVALISGLSVEQLNDIQTDLWLGVINRNDHFSFRDEDFENFLRREYPRTDSINKGISDVFLSYAETEEYASTHLGMALFNANMADSLQTTVLENRYLNHPSDPIKNKDVQVERTRLAMKMSGEQNNKLNLIKLQMVAAEAAKTNSVLEQILVDKAELASSYGDLQMNQRIYFQSGNPAWFGHVHFRSAAVYSRTVATHDLAKQHLNKAYDWMGYRNRLTKEERNDYRISDKDIAYGAESVLRISGAAECIKWLGSWTPREAVYKAVEILLHNLVEAPDKAKLKQWVKGISVDPTYQLLIIRVFFEYGIKPPFVLGDLLNNFSAIEAVATKTSSKLYKDILAFCEYALYEGAGFDKIKPWVSLINITKPQHVPSFYEGHYAGLDEDKHQMDIMFRKECLLAFFEKRSLSVADFYPQSLTTKLKGKENQYNEYNDEEKRKFDSIYKHFLPIYEVRIAFLLKVMPVKKLQVKLQALLNDVQQDYEMQHYHRLGFNYVLKFMAVRLADIAIWKSSDTVIESISKAFSTKEENNIILFLGLSKRISGLSRYHKDVLELLKKVEVSIELLTLPGEEQLDHFTDATIIAGRISLDTGKYYFDKMVLSAAVIDIEGHQQIKSISKMISSEDNWNNPKLSYLLSRFVEYSYASLKGFDHFPWHDSMLAIARLDSASAFALSCRWDHRGIRDLQENFTEVIEEGLNQNFITHTQAAAILQINHYIFPGLIKIISKIFDGFDSTADYVGKGKFLQMVVKEFKLNFTVDHDFKTLDLFKEILDNGKFLNKETVSEFQIFYRQIAVFLKKDSKSEKDEKQFKIRNRAHTNYGKSIKKIDLSSNEDIIRLFEKLKEEAENNYVDFENLFREFRKAVKPDDYVNHLNMLINLEPGLLDFYSYEKALVAAIKEWSIYPSVLAWKKISFNPFLKSKFAHYFSNGYFSVDALKQMGEVFGINGSDLSETVLNIIPDYLYEFDAAALFQLLEITNHSITKEEKNELLEWLIPRWSEKIKDSLGDGPWDTKFIPPDDSSNTLAYFLRYLLAHPVKSNRWKAAHAIRRLSQLNEKVVVDCLLNLQSNVQNGIFQDAQMLFYWISAKLYLWISIERVCREDPAFFTTQASRFFEELKGEELPHTLIQLFIKNSCLTIQKHKKGTFNSNEIFVIKQVLMNKKKRKQKPDIKTASAKKTTFKFDDLDTIPYWYSPLARALNCNMSDLLSLADTLITQKWGYKGDGRKGDPAFAKEWTMTTNRHGNVPSIENLRNYFEYHAMFCAAGEVLKSSDLLSKWDDSDNDENWASWLNGKALYWAHYWLSDLRDPTPLLPKLWLKSKVSDWQWNVSIKDFDDLTTLENVHNSDDLPIWMRIRKKYGKDYETCSIHTALVSPVYALSALLSLQTSKRLNPNIPLEEDEEQEYNEWASQDKRFRLKGWIKNITSNGEGLDTEDIEFRDISKGRLAIGGEFSKWANLIFAKDFRFSYLTENPSAWITKLETWSNGKINDRYDDFSTEGERLLMKKKQLMPFLADTNQCLIINCEIDRHVERMSGEKYLDPYSYLYIIYPNGTINTISRAYKLG